MNNVLILLDNLDDWKPYYETSSVLTVSDYLKNKPVEKDRKLVINLSNDYSYNSEGYYCSLLAQTRGQRVIPDVDIINKLETGTGIRMDRSLQALCYQWIQKNGIKSDIWYVNPSWEARIGFAYDNSPIEPEYRSLSIPDSDRIWYSAGATYHINPDMSLDFGMAYLDGKEVDVNEGLRNHSDALRWKGTSHGNALLASTQFNMKF